MTDDTVYTAVLDSGDDQESIRLETVDGSPQKTLIRSAVLDGEEIEVVWELEDEDAIDGRYVYRPIRVEADTDDSGIVARDLTEPRGTSDFAGE